MECRSCIPCSVGGLDDDDDDDHLLRSYNSGRTVAKFIIGSKYLRDCVGELGGGGGGGGEGGRHGRQVCLG